MYQKLVESVAWELERVWSTHFEIEGKRTKRWTVEENKRSEMVIVVKGTSANFVLTSDNEKCYYHIYLSLSSISTKEGKQKNEDA